MNSIDRLEQQYDSSEKSFKCKIVSGKKERATNQYFKDAAARSRRKQGKTNYDTFRRDEQPNEEDLWLEDIYFANFLGLKDIVNGTLHKNWITNCPVNVCDCDYLRPQKDDTASEIAPQDVEEDDYDYINIQDYNNIRERAHMDLGNGWYFKRGLDETNEEQPEAKRARNEDIFASMVAYMIQQVKLAQQMVDNGEL